MKKIFFLILLVISELSAYCQTYEMYEYKFYACYDASGNDMSAGSNDDKLTVAISDLGFGLTLSAYILPKPIGGVPPAMSMPLVPVTEVMKYVGTNNGWYIFRWMFISVYISTDTKTARVEKRYNNKYMGYSEYRR